MTRVLIFGGTTEGRYLCQLAAANNLPVLYCVATAEGAGALPALPGIEVRVGRLEAAAMQAVMAGKELVIDATHPYAEKVSHNIKTAAGQAGLALIRVKRAACQEQKAEYFAGMTELLAALREEAEDAVIFSSLGSSAAAALTGLAGYRDRVWLRILPSLTSLKICLDQGYNPARIIAMQGPFTEELNYAMFRYSGAGILLTKDSGSMGGFREKLAAAERLSLKVLVLARPDQDDGLSLPEVAARLLELKKCEK